MARGRRTRTCELSPTPDEKPISKMRSTAVLMTFSL